MKTMIFATAAVLGIGIGAAHAGDGDGPTANSFFTQLPGVIAQAPVRQVPSAVARNQNGAATATFATRYSSAISIFPWNPNAGVGN